MDQLDQLVPVDDRTGRGGQHLAKRESGWHGPVFLRQDVKRVVEIVKGTVDKVRGESPAVSRAKLAVALRSKTAWGCASAGTDAVPAITVGFSGTPSADGCGRRGVWLTGRRVMQFWPFRV